MNIIGKDLNVLGILSVLAEERNLTRASKRLGLSQPTLSHALNKLRRDFNDPLFVRASKGLVPTPKVQELLPQLKVLLSTAESLYGETTTNDLKAVRRSIVLGATTYFEIRVLNHLAAKLSFEVPLSRIETISLQGDFPKQELEDGRMDLAVAAYFEDLPEGFKMRIIGRDPFVCICRKKNPYLKTRQDLSAYLQAKHLSIDVPKGTTPAVDQILTSKKLGQRRIHTKVGNFLSPLFLISDSDFILTCPESLAKTYAQFAPLEVCELPMRVPSIEIKMVWHERLQEDLLSQWLRNQIVALAK